MLGRVGRVTQGHVTIAVEDPDSADARWCIGEYFAELDVIFDHGYDPGRAVTVTSDDLRAPHGAFLIARLDGKPVGCAGVKLPPGEPAFFKRMWVSPDARGHGIGGALLTALEETARTAGATVVRFDTNSTLATATALYRRRGYQEVPDFNGEPHADLWFAKDL